MAPLIPRRTSPVRTVLIASLSLAAALGWGLYGLSRHVASGVENDLRQEIASLKAAHADLATQASQARADLLTLVQLRDENVSARGEIERLTQSLRQAQAELAAARSVLSPSPDPWTAAEKAAAQPETSTASAATAERVETAQQALSRLGYGPLVADGILGPSTRGAIERFQREQHLDVTGELDEETWQRLRGGAGVVAVD